MSEQDNETGAPKGMPRKVFGETRRPPGLDGDSNQAAPKQDTGRRGRGKKKPSGPSATQRASSGSTALVSTDQDKEKAVAEVLSRRRGFKRKPFGILEMRLSAPKRPGYHRHWFNEDEKGRLEQAQNAGYEFVQENGNPMKRPAGVKDGGGVMYAYLMEIPELWWEQDMAAAQKVCDEIDAAISGGNMSRKERDERYIPRTGIKMEDEEMSSPVPD